jgi:hypothetical protein
MRMAFNLRLGLGAAALLLGPTLGCTPEPDEITPSAYPAAGLYTPGSTLGASDPTDVPMRGMGLGNRCVPFASEADGGMTSGSGTAMLRIDYTTVTLHGRYAPKNCSAVWLETVEGRYVATLEIRAGLRRPGLAYWQDHACIDKPGPDVVTSATLADHTKPHMVMWSGHDFGGNLMPDGPYKLFIEVTESDKEPGELATFAIEKGPTQSSVEAPVAFDGALRQVTIAWSSKQPGRPGGAAGAH